MGPIYQLTSTDQRHKATFNGIWDIGKGLQLSGLYFFGSGQRCSHELGQRPAEHRRRQLQHPDAGDGHGERGR